MKRNIGVKLFELVKYEIDPFLYGLFEGGAFGHLAHPFEEVNLTFGEIRKIVNDLLSGNVEAIEKVDGQQLSFTWKEGRLRGARNKSHIREFGKNSLTASQLKSFFDKSNLPTSISIVFYLAMIDLEKALSKLPQDVLTDMFQEGKRFMNTEIVASETQNVIRYYKDYIVFHSLIEYDINGNPIKHLRGYEKQLEDMINQVGAADQSKYQIKGPNKIVLKNFHDLPMEKESILSELDKIQKHFSDNTTIGQTQEFWWKEFILKKADEMNYDIPDKTLNMLINRWARLDRSNSIYKILLNIDNEQFKNWVRVYDKNEHKNQYKKNLFPYELFFFKLGAMILSKASGYLTASPIKTISDIAKRIHAESEKIKQSGNVSDINYLKNELEKLKKIGEDKIVGSEGIVFSYNGKLYKLTGVFQAVNRILSIFKYKKNKSIQKENDEVLSCNDILHEEFLYEGGNCVYSNDKIKKENLIPTLKNALHIWGLNKLRNYEIVGNIHKPFMNDIDVAINIDDMIKLLNTNYDNLWRDVKLFLEKNKPKDIPQPSFKINPGIQQIHISAPIIGQEGKFIQIDLMLGDVSFMKDALSSPDDKTSKYKSVYRNLLLSNILKFSHEPTNVEGVFKKYQFNWKQGLQQATLIKKGNKFEKTNVTTIYNNMDDVASFLFGDRIKFRDINTFEKLFKLLDNPSFKYRKNKDEIIKGFLDDLKKLKLPIQL